MRLLGIPISIDVSWLLIIVFLTVSFAFEFPRELHQFFPGATALPAYGYWIMGLVTALAFFACILLHELGHAVVARARGMPISGITLFLLGGVSELGDEPPSAITEFLMAIAGPAVSLVIAIVCWLLAIAGYQANWPHPVVLVLGYLAIVNAMVLVFNMLPAFPLDGGRVFRSILWGATGNLRRSTFWAAMIGRGFGWLMMGAGIWLVISGALFNGILLGLVGLFLSSGAQASYQQVIVRQALQGEPVRRFMNANPIVVPPSVDLAHWVDEYVYRHHHRAFPVVSDGHLEGLITTQALDAIPRSEWSAHTVGEVMITDLRPVRIRADADALAAFSKMQRSSSSRLLVVDGDRLVGLISVKDLLRFLNLKLELEETGSDEHGPHSAAVAGKRKETYVER
jgi:Zn-dependent protease/CBS domain-containing protein